MPHRTDIDVFIGGNIAGLSEALARAETAANTSSRRMSASFAQAGAALTGIWAGATVVKEGIAIFAGVEDKILNAGSAANLTTHQIELMMQKTLELGGEPAQTPLEVAAGFEQAAKSGQSFNDAMLSIIPNAQLAAGSELELGEAVKTTTRILSQFGLQAKDTQGLVDVLIAGANSASVTVTEMAESYQYAGSISDSMGQSVNNTAAALLVLANASIAGEQGGTALRGLWATLLQKSDELSASYGVQVETLEGNKVVTRDLADIIDDLSAAQMTAKERFDIFGKLTMPAVSAMIKKGGKAIRDYEHDLDNAGGTGERVAKIMQSGLGGALRSITSSGQLAGVILGREFTPILKLVADYSYLAGRGVNFLVGTVDSVAAALSAAVGAGLDFLSVTTKVADFIGLTDNLSKELSNNAKAAYASAKDLADKANKAFVEMKGNVEKVTIAEVDLDKQARKAIDTSSNRTQAEERRIAKVAQEEEKSLAKIAKAEEKRAKDEIKNIKDVADLAKQASEARASEDAAMYKTIGEGADAYFQAEAEKILSQGDRWIKNGATKKKTILCIFQKSYINISGAI